MTNVIIIFIANKFKLRWCICANYVNKNINKNLRGFGSLLGYLADETKSGLRIIATCLGVINFSWKSKCFRQTRSKVPQLTPLNAKRPMTQYMWYYSPWVPCFSLFHSMISGSCVTEQSSDKSTEWCQMTLACSSIIEPLLYCILINQRQKLCALSTMTSQEKCSFSHIHVAFVEYNGTFKFSPDFWKRIF